MRIKLNHSIIQKFPGLRYAVFVVKEVRNERRNSALMQLLRGISVVKRNELKRSADKENFLKNFNETLKENATLFESYLLQVRMKKILNGKEFSTDNNVSDCLLYFSLKFFVPIFGFDMDKREKDYVIDFHIPKKGKKLAEPDFSRETKNFVFWVADIGTAKDDEFMNMLGELQNLILKYCGGTISDLLFLDAENTEADLVYVSEKEKEYQEKLQLEAEENMKLESALSESQFDDDGKLMNEGEFANLSENGDKALSIKEKLTILITNALPKIQDQEGSQENISFSAEEASAEIEIEVPKDGTHGDYSTNIALKFAKKMGKSPMEIAENLCQAIEKADFVESIEVKAPGFINFKFSLNYLEAELQKIIKLQDKYGKSNLGKGEKVMIEFGSLNIAKPFGAHHFLTTVIGQTIVNLYRHSGYQVLAADYPGDWGTQFGKLIYAFKNWGKREEINTDPIGEFLKLYIRFHDEADKEPSLEDKAREEFKKMEEGDEENLRLWKEIREISLKDLETIYRTMGVEFDRVYPESKYVETSREILIEGKAKGVFIEGEKGAYIVDLEAEGLPPALIQKSDGTTLYLTRDIASLKERSIENNLKKIIYVVDVAQSLHFKQFFATAKKLHLTDAELLHVPYGRMNMPEGSMSTRKGNIILGKDLIQESVSRLLKIVQEKSPQLSSEEHLEIAKGASIGAIKYAMVCQNPETNFVFEWDKVLSFEGNSGPYLQYTQARANSILRKAKEAENSKKSDRNSDDQVSLFSLEEERKAQEEKEQKPFENEYELRLLKTLIKFPLALESAENNKPNFFTTYLFELAQAFNAFYHAVPVLTTQQPELFEARLSLVKASAQVLKNGLKILGIETFERM